jgi:hypothetical protein
MIGRDTELDAGGFRLCRSAVAPIGILVRTFGAFERMYHGYEQTRTIHFCVVAELAEVLVPSALDVSAHLELLVAQSLVRSDELTATTGSR